MKTDDAKAHDEMQVHEYDGIIEHDNPLPRWWLVTFVGTVLFAVGYFYHFEVFKSAQTPTEEFQAEMEQKARQKMAGKHGGGVSGEVIASMATDPAKVKDGESTYQQFCVACHGQQGEGKIGPNLTDKFWLHGGKPDELYKTISTGVVEKGMPAWEQTLGPMKTQVVTAYVLSLKGKNVPGKEAQGTEEKEN